MAFRELPVGFVGFANDFLSLLPGQALFSLDLEFDKFSVLFIGVHSSHLLCRASQLSGAVLIQASLTGHYTAIINSNEWPKVIRCSWMAQNA